MYICSYILRTVSQALSVLSMASYSKWLCVLHDKCLYCRGIQCTARVDMHYLGWLGEAGCLWGLYSSRPLNTFTGPELCISFTCTACMYSAQGVHAQAIPFITMTALVPFLKCHVTRMHLLFWGLQGIKLHSIAHSSITKALVQIPRVFNVDPMEQCCSVACPRTQGGVCCHYSGALWNNRLRFLCGLMICHHSWPVVCTVSCEYLLTNKLTVNMLAMNCIFITCFTHQRISGSRSALLQFLSKLIIHQRT